MTRLLIALASLAFLALILSGAPVSAQPVCMSPAEIQAILDSFGEKRVWRGLNHNGILIEVYVAEPSQAHNRGTWTVIARTPGGAVCFLSEGLEWHLEPLPEGERAS